MKYNLRNKAVVLTGGSRGIGRAVALRLAKEGARLGLVARNEAKLADTVKLVEALKKGKYETGTVMLPKVLSAIFAIHPPWADRINRMFLPD